ncbi:MAG: CHAT domain-containing protein, partial [Bacteroidota bacterium]
AQHLLLDEQSALVEYFLGRNHLHTFTVYQGEVAWYRTALQPDLVGQIETFREALAPAHWQVSGSALGDSLGMELYQQLWLPLQTWTPAPQQLILVPDEYLAYLPFDALLEQAPTQPGYYPDYAFLGRKYHVSYAYSATWLYEVQRIQRLANQPQQWVGMAPTSFPRLGDLPFSRNEIEGIHDRYGGKALVGSKAKREAFVKWAPETRLLHLSTHAGLHDSTPELSAIYFAEGDSVSLQEIASMQIPADLVVLSACETGIGELKSGEGLLSLGRAFSQAGAKSLLTTLWQVNDATTEQVMKRFYAALSEGKSKATALHLAKMEQLSLNDPILSHPYFWAGYSMWGERTGLTITPQDASPFWLIGGIVLILLFVGGGIYRQATKA